MMAGIGIDIGGTYIKFFVVDGNGRVVARASLPTEPQKGPLACMEMICRVVLNWKKLYGKNTPVGIGLAGDVDPENGVLRFSPNLAKWRDVEVLRLFKRFCSHGRCVLENDANMAAWGAYAHELRRKYANVLAVTLGTGIGGGLVLEHKLFHGAYGSAGEIGHVNVVPGGDLCNCGSRGCLEAYAGSYAIIRRAKKLAAAAPARSALRKICSGGDITTLALASAAGRGDAAARRLWRETGECLGRGIADAVLLLNPDAVVLAGGVSGAHRHFLPAMKSVFAKQGISSPFRKMKIAVSGNSNLGGIGAALYACQS